jgi:hypothetical protein
LLKPKLRYDEVGGRRPSPNRAGGLDVGLNGRRRADAAAIDRRKKNVAREWPTADSRRELTCKSPTFRRLLAAGYGTLLF